MMTTKHDFKWWFTFLSYWVGSMVAGFLSYVGVRMVQSGPAAAKLLQLCLTLWDPTDGSPPGSPIPRILQARTLEWVAIALSNAWKWKRSRSVVCDSQRPHGLQPTRLLCPWDFPGKSTGVGCHCLLQQSGPKNDRLCGGHLSEVRIFISVGVCP